MNKKIVNLLRSKVEIVLRRKNDITSQPRGRASEKKEFKMQVVSKKNWFILLILWIIDCFTCCCGFHRCYQGGVNIVFGLLCCLSWGCFGIGWCIDGISLFTGTLTDGDDNEIPVDARCQEHCSVFVSVCYFGSNCFDCICTGFGSCCSIFDHCGDCGDCDCNCDFGA